MGWDSSEQIAELGAYAEWEIAAARSVFDDRLIVPAFVRLRLDSTERDLPVLDQVRAMPNTQRGQRFISDFELDYLATARETRSYNHRDFVTCVYCRPEAIFDDRWEVLATGSPLPLPEPSTRVYEGVPVVPPMNMSQGEPIIAVIDDAIGFLNARFCSDPVTTRFEAVWLMTHASATPPTGAAAGQTVIGRVFESADINALLAQGRDEAAIYHEINDTIFGFGQHKGLNLQAGHGTHILDIADGHDPASRAPASRLLAVQLPAEAIVATSGRRLELYILKALRWIMSRVRAIAATTGVLHPVLVNLSLGALAGPKDGTGRFESLLRGLLADPGAVPRGMTVRIIAAFGNARRDRLAIGSTIQGGGSLTFDWRIQPDDGTSSYLEIRTPKGMGQFLRLEIAPPGRISTLQTGRLPTATEMYQYLEGGDLAAGVYAMPEANHDTVLVAVNATRPDLVAAPGDAGAWAFTLTNTAESPCDVSVRVQRDDTPYGYRTAGRQSWLDAPDAWEWDVETMGWTRPSGRTVCRDQTDVNYSSIGDPRVYLVAAGEPSTTAKDRLRATRYSAEGGGPGLLHPTMTAMADRGRMHPGRRASGIVTGTVAIFSGTSVAAPIATRALAEQLRAGASVRPSPPGRFPPKNEVRPMIRQASARPDDPRIGAGFLPRR